jgi:hypothetical protein
VTGGRSPAASTHVRVGGRRAHDASVPGLSAFDPNRKQRASARVAIASAPKRTRGKFRGAAVFFRRIICYLFCSDVRGAAANAPPFRTIRVTIVLGNLSLLSTIGLAICLNASADAACIDLKQTDTLSFEGTLNYRIFAGPPNYEDVRKGDTPEPTYVLKLDEPICATGDEFVDQNVKFDRIQIFPESGKAGQALWRDLRSLIGQRVVVAGGGAFGRHTGHHHAPLMLPIANISAAFDPTKSHGTSMTTVQGFYLALSAGNGEEAVKFVVPEKRSSGPLSAIAIRNFYSNLVEPLTLIDVVPTRPDEYRVRYTYVAPSRGRCDGEALVRTTKLNGLNLIDSIKAISGC